MESGIPANDIPSYMVVMLGMTDSADTGLSSALQFIIFLKKNGVLVPSAPSHFPWHISCEVIVWGEGRGN